jgi:hypothetical protein
MDIRVFSDLPDLSCTDHGTEPEDKVGIGLADNVPDPGLSVFRDRREVYELEIFCHFKDPLCQVTHDMPPRGRFYSALARLRSERSRLY